MFVSPAKQVYGAVVYPRDQSLHLVRLLPDQDDPRNYSFLIDALSYQTKLGRDYQIGWGKTRPAMLAIDFSTVAGPDGRGSQLVKDYWYLAPPVHPPPTPTPIPTTPPLKTGSLTSATGQ